MTLMGDEKFGCALLDPLAAHSGVELYLKKVATAVPSHLRNMHNILIRRNGP